jgi:hypothetical protein
MFIIIKCSLNVCFILESPVPRRDSYFHERK